MSRSDAVTIHGHYPARYFCEWSKAEVTENPMSGGRSSMSNKHKEQTYMQGEDGIHKHSHDEDSVHEHSHQHGYVHDEHRHGGDGQAENIHPHEHEHGGYEHQHHGHYHNHHSHKRGETVLEIKNMSISFTQYSKGFNQIQLPVIKDLNVAICAGEMVAVVGSSGSGKSLLAHGVMGILPYNATMGGEMYYCGEPLTEKRIEKLRGNEIVMVPQSTSYLDPLMKIGPQIKKGHKDDKTVKKLRTIFKRYSLDESVEQQYPFELSGGMTRRTLIATAMMGNPKLVVADEPTPGLHMNVAKKAMDHFRELADMGAGVLLITHDLELALEVADRVVVFYAGTTIEEANAEDFAHQEKLRHPYTKALWQAIPQNGFSYIDGVQPYVKDMPEGCPFGPRCSQYTKRCGETIPYQQLRNGYVRCCHAQ